MRIFQRIQKDFETQNRVIHLTRNFRSKAQLIGAFNSASSHLFGSGAFQPITDRAGGVLTVTGDGEGELRLLTYDLEVGHVDRLVMTMDMIISVDIEGVGSERVEIPTLTMVLEQEVVAINENGDYDIEGKIVEVSVANFYADSAELDRQLQAALGFKARTTMTPRGVILSGSIDVPPGLDPAAAQMLEQLESQFSELGSPLPSVPVGLGATWTYEATLDVGFEQRAITKYTVVALVGDEVTLQTVTTVDISGDALEFPGLPADTEVEIIEYRSTPSEGTIDLDLTRSVPLSSRSAVDADIEMRITTGGERLTMRQGLSIDVRMSAE